MLILIKYNTNTPIVWLLTVYYSTFQVLVIVIIFLNKSMQHHTIIINHLKAENVSFNLNRENPTKNKSRTQKIRKSYSPASLIIITKTFVVNS